MPNLNAQTRERLLDLLHALIDQKRARVLVRPYRDAPGFWFGGGNLVQDTSGTIWMSGRSGRVMTCSKRPTASLNNDTEWVEK